jgi:hypothetical protein
MKYFSSDALAANLGQIARDVAVICGPDGITLSYSHSSFEGRHVVRAEIPYPLCDPQQGEALRAQMQLFRFRVARERFKASRN